jgi:hypothetical protein
LRCSTKRQYACSPSAIAFDQRIAEYDREGEVGVLAVVVAPRF